MAQSRQEVEEYQAAFLSCLAALGVQGQPTIGGVVNATVPAKDGKPVPGAIELAEEAMSNCSEHVPEPSLWAAPADRDDYQRMIDVRDCLIAHGFPVPEPPSAEVWLEQRRDSDQIAWSPYTAIFGDDKAGHVEQFSREELTEINVACPQNGTGGFYVSYAD
ncbi:MAG: hypothetical protein LBB54_06125 [Cellulomonadaceae bacterium]|jgi:hypothetical protein|nr:hypothetical protein [Cellulomonadaceae bacterium]